MFTKHANKKTKMYLREKFVPSILYIIMRRINRITTIAAIFIVSILLLAFSSRRNFELSQQLSIFSNVIKDLENADGELEASKVYNGEEVGFFVGANMKLNIPQKPVLYTQFVWNMDPYKGFGDGQDFINYDGYTIDSGVENYAGAGAFRVALRWDF